MAGRRPKGRPEALSNLLRNSFEGTNLGERLKDLAIWQYWEQAVGTDIARRARPLRFGGGVLTVAVGSAPWMQQLSFMKVDLVARLNSCLGEQRVREIVLRSGRVSDAEGETVQAERPTPRRLRQQTQVWIEQQCSVVEDPELKQQFRALMEDHYRSSGS